MVATTSKIVLALALTGASAAPGHHKFSMKPRMRTLREEVSGRVAKYQAHAQSLRSEIPAGAVKQDSTVDHTSTAFWGYPATLDYTVDVAFSTGALRSVFRNGRRASLASLTPRAGLRHVV